MEQRTRHRIAAKASNTRIGHKPVQAKPNDRSASLGSLYLCKWKEINNNDYSGKAGENTETRT